MLPAPTARLRFRTWRPTDLPLALRLCGTMIAFVAAPRDVIFHHVPWAPTIQGQYLVKDVCLLGAALVIGGTVHVRRRGKRAKSVG